MLSDVMSVLLILGLVGSAQSVSSGLTVADLYAFKPIDRDRVEQNTGLKGEVSITGASNGKSYLTVYTNGIPSHDNFKWPRGDEDRPIHLKETKAAFNIPKVPKLRDNPIMCVPFGIVGVATGGVLIYNAYTPRKDCPIALQVEAFDMCYGHPDPGGAYHYHSHSTCNSMDVCGEPSTIFGVALDGIPIYGPFDENGKQLVQEDLDICGGRVDKEGRYKYHITGDPPYLLNCFRGELHKDLWNTDHPKGWKPFEMDCTCPFDDSSFPACFEDPWCEDETDSDDPAVRAAAEKAFGARVRGLPNKPLTCDWNNTVGDFATCTDKVNTSYTPSFKQVKEQSTISLIPCCPKGKDCGASCVNNTKCYTEQRTGSYMVTRILSSGGARAGAHIMGLVVVLLMLLVLW